MASSSTQFKRSKTCIVATCPCTSAVLTEPWRKETLTLSQDPRRALPVNKFYRLERGLAGHTSEAIAVRVKILFQRCWVTASCTLVGVVALGISGSPADQTAKRQSAIWQISMSTVTRTHPSQLKMWYCGLSGFCRFSVASAIRHRCNHTSLSADRSPRPLTVSTDPGWWNDDWQANGHCRAPLTVSTDPGRWNDDWQAKSRRRISFHNSPPTSRWQAGASRGFPP